MISYIREPINGLTHLFGAVLSRVGLIMLINKAAVETESTLAITAVASFGISLIILSSALAAYRMVLAKDRIIGFLRRLYHAMIFVLVAGTYTPFCVIGLSVAAGWSLFCVIAGLALVGIGYKLVWV